MTDTKIVYKKLTMVNKWCFKGKYKDFLKQKMYCTFALMNCLVFHGMHLLNRNRCMASLKICWNSTVLMFKLRHYFRIPMCLYLFCFLSLSLYFGFLHSGFGDTKTCQSIFPLNSAGYFSVTMFGFCVVSCACYAAQHRVKNLSVHCFFLTCLDVMRLRYSF